MSHAGHFNDCEISGRYSTVYLDYLCCDMRPQLLGALRELEIRAARVLAGEPRRRVLNLLYQRQDEDEDQLVSFFIQGTDAESPWQLGFGHQGAGHMGITDPQIWQDHIDEFRENVWLTVVRESRKSLHRAPE